MTSAVGGEGGTPKADESIDKLRECDRDRGGCPKIRKCCVRHLSMAPKGNVVLLHIIITFKGGDDIPYCGETSISCQPFYQLMLYRKLYEKDT